MSNGRVWISQAARGYNPGYTYVTTRTASANLPCRLRPPCRAEYQAQKSAARAEKAAKKRAAALERQRKRAAARLLRAQKMAAKALAQAARAIPRMEPAADSGRCIGNYCVEFNPRDGLNSIVNIGRGASGGLTDTVANKLSPGASSTVEQNRVQQGIGFAGSLVATGGAYAGAHASRVAYVARAEEISQTAKSGAQAVAARNALKNEARQTLPSPIRVLLEQRNMGRYGAPLGPTYSQLLKKYGSDAAVIEAAGRTSPLINRLLLVR
jgi:hypothetical protein